MNINPKIKKKIGISFLIGLSLTWLISVGVSFYLVDGWFGVIGWFGISIFIFFVLKMIDWVVEN